MHMAAIATSEMFPVFMYQFGIFIVSIAMLAKASQMVIKNSVELAKLTKMGELVIGVVVLSVTTSLPELAVSFSAITSGNVGVSIGNIFGSNIANLGLVLSIPAIMSPMDVKRGTFEKLPTILFLSSIIPLAFLAMEEVGQFVGIILIGSFVFFTYYSISRNIEFKIPKKRKKSKGLLQNLMLPFKFYKVLFLLLMGILVVILSSNFVVSSSSKISEIMGIDESVIGATIIAIGTSLPELSVSLSAIRDKHPKLAIGNAIGSCLTNITLILGIVLLMSPVTVNSRIFSTLLFFVIGITMIAWYFFTTGKKLDRREGMILLFVYIMFLISTFGIQITIL